MDWTTFATVVTAVATFVAAGAAVGVIFIYRKQVSIGQKQVQVSQEQVRVSQEQTRLALDTLREMQETRDAQTAPYVVVYVELQESIVYLVMENLGQMMAENISVHFEPPLQEKHLIIKTIPTFISGITPNLAPKQQIRTGFNGFSQLLNNPDFPPSYKVTVQYQGGTPKKERQETYVLDIKSFENIAYTRQDELDEQISKGVKPVVEAVSSATYEMEKASKRLDFGLTTSAAMMSLLDGWNAEDPAARFKDIIRGLASDWRIWQDMEGHNDFLLEQRIYLAVQTIGVLSLKLPLTDRELDRLRLLTLKLGTARKYLSRDNEEDEIPNLLQELVEIADSLEPPQPI